MFRACRKFAGLAVVVATLTCAVPAKTQDLVKVQIGADDLMGKWCGDISNYVFTRQRLVVTWHDRDDRRVMAIKKIVEGGSWLDVHWSEGGNTVFKDFSDDRNVMFQAANTSGDMGPRRRFRRC